MVQEIRDSTGIPIYGPNTHYWVNQEYSREPQGGHMLSSSTWFSPIN